MLAVMMGVGGGLILAMRAVPLELVQALGKRPAWQTGSVLWLRSTTH